LDEITGEPVAGQRYRIEFADGRIVRGRTDALGLTRRVMTEAGVGLKLFWEAKPHSPARDASAPVDQEC
jgi:hypothetical protein